MTKTKLVTFVVLEWKPGGPWRRVESFEEGQWLEGAEREASLWVGNKRVQRRDSTFRVVREVLKTKPVAEFLPLSIEAKKEVPK